MGRPGELCNINHISDYDDEVDVDVVYTTICSKNNRNSKKTVGAAVSIASLFWSII
jgi:hypothetical protein